MRSIWIRYWEANGGFFAIANSWFFWTAVFLTLASYRFWLAPGWWDLPISVLPNLLGFSIGGLAILVGVIKPETMSVFGDRTKSTHSILTKFTASFTHFVLVQATALIFAIVCKANFPDAPNSPPASQFQLAVSFFSWLTFIYALTLTFATTVEVFRFSEMLQDFERFNQSVLKDEQIYSKQQFQKLGRASKEITQSEHE